jgi:hypothetical protein
MVYYDFAFTLLSFKHVDKFDYFVLVLSYLCYFLNTRRIHLSMCFYRIIKKVCFYRTFLIVVKIGMSMLKGSKPQTP